MRKPNTVILSISLSAKRIGYALFEGEVLLNFAIKSFSSPRTPDSTLRQAIGHLDKLRDQYPIGHLLIRLPRESATSPMQRYLVHNVALAFRKRGSSISFADHNEAFRQIAGSNEFLRSNIYMMLSRSFPELQRYTNSQNRSQREYSFVLLSAVAIGLASNSRVARYQ